jgi:hypothetical protein
MTSVAPRLARQFEIPIHLYCGFPRCGTRVGELDENGVRRTFPYPLPEKLPGDPPALRALIEAQAPEAARCGVAYVLPEGFKQSRPSGVWVMTRRARERRFAIHNDWLPITATHRRRPHAGALEFFATAPALPAEVRCPECGRINIVSAELLTEFLPGVRDRWNADLAGDTGRWLRSLWDEPRRSSAVSQDGPAANHPARRTSLPIDFTTTAMFSRPRHTLLIEALSGRPIRLEDFFVIEPDRPYLQPVPDPEHRRLLLARAEAMPPVATRRPPR